MTLEALLTEYENLSYPEKVQFRKAIKKPFKPGNPPKEFGRPSAPIYFPEGQFTFEDLFELNRASNAVYLRRRLMNDVASGAIEQIGKISNGVGRPKAIFRKKVGL